MSALRDNVDEATTHTHHLVCPHLAQLATLISEFGDTVLCPAFATIKDRRDPAGRTVRTGRVRVVLPGLAGEFDSVKQKMESWAQSQAGGFYGVVGCIDGSLKPPFFAKALPSGE